MNDSLKECVRAGDVLLNSLKTLCVLLDDQRFIVFERLRVDPYNVCPVDYLAVYLDLLITPRIDRHPKHTKFLRQPAVLINVTKSSAINRIISPEYDENGRL